MKPSIAPAVLLLLATGLVTCIKFALPALHADAGGQKNRRCISAYVGNKILVRGEYESAPAEHQSLEIHVYDTSLHANKYYQHNHVDGRGKFAFTTLDHAEVFVCFTNTLDQSVNPSPTLQRDVFLTLETGADAKEDSAFEEKTEHLKPVEIELLRLEALMDDIVEEIQYLKHRSSRMRNTNESTNSRVLWFSILSIATLILLGSWQVMYLQKFFAAKKLI